MSGANCWGCEVGVCRMMRPMPERETECIVGRQWSAIGPVSARHALIMLE